MTAQELSALIPVLLDRPAEERFEFFKVILQKLVEKTDINQLAVLAIGKTGMEAQILLLDLQNEAMLKNYGLVRVPPPPAVPPPATPGSPNDPGEEPSNSGGDESPQNPLAN